MRSLNDLALLSSLTGLGGWLTLVGLVFALGSSSALCCVGIAYIGWIAAILTGYLARQEIGPADRSSARLARLGLLSGGAGFMIGTVLVVFLVLSALGLISPNVLGNLLGQS